MAEYITRDADLEIRIAEDEQGIIEGVVSAYGVVDTERSVVERGAFTKTLKERKTLPILWMHDRKEPIGVQVSASDSDTGLFVRGKLNLETRRGAEAYSLIKQGAMSGLSVGMWVYQDKVSVDKAGVRHFHEVKLDHWSPITTGMQANPKAVITEVRSANDAVQYLIAHPDELKSYDPEMIRVLRSLMEPVESRTPDGEPDSTPTTQDETIDPALEAELRSIIQTLRS